MRIGWCSLLAILFAPAAALAQGALPGDPVNTGRIQAGPVQLNPRVELRELGVDSNIYDEPQSPVQDFTFTVRPSLGAGMRLGRGRIVSSGWLDFVYFKDHPDERAINKFGDVRGELRLERVIPFVTASALSAKDRPNSEIDVRAQRLADDVAAGVAVALFSRTAVYASFKDATLAYEEGQVVEGRDIAIQLNNTIRRTEAGIRMALTTLTTLSVSASREEQRFQYSDERDSNSTRLEGRFDFDPDAVIHGVAVIGYRRFAPLNSLLRDYSGLVLQAQVGWKYQDRTTVDVRASRDVDYSVQQAFPYYIRSVLSVTARQRIGGPFDVQGTLARDALHYQTLNVAGVSAEGALDTTRTAQAGVGYWFGETTRAGFNYEYGSRAGRERRQYSRHRVFGSLAYGF